MASCATFDALDAFAFLPQLVRGVGLVSFAIGFVYAAAADEGGENAFVGTFVYREVAFAAFEVACRFLVRVLISCRWMLVLNGNDAGPGGFFPNCPGNRKVRLRSFMFQELATFIESLLYGFCGQPLVDSYLASMALKPTAVWFPLVMALLPCIAALLDESFFVLFCGVSCSPDWLLMDVVLAIFVDLLQPGCSVLIHLQVVLV